MAIIQLGSMVTDIRGSVNGWTFQRNSAGLVIRARSGVGKGGTNKQFQKRQFPNQYANLWAALSLADQLLWNAFAAIHPRITTFGSSRTITGYNWFASINYNLVLFGSPLISVPPPYVTPPAVASYTIAFSGSGIFLLFSPQFEPEVSGLLIWTTQPLTRVSTSLRSQFRSTYTTMSSPYATIDLTSAWESAHGLSWSSVALGGSFNIGFMVQCVETGTGIASPGLLLVAPVTGLANGIGSMRIGSSFIIS